MILPRSHTWLHLLPAGMGFDCPGVPAWFRGPLDGRGTPGGARGLVTWRPGEAARLQVEGYDAVVAVDPAPGVRRRLRAAGFARQDRFAVLPDLTEPRWFIPLGAPAVSRAAFCLYTPFRWAAHLKVAAVRGMITARVPWWYAHEVCVARRGASPFDELLERLFPGERVSVALSSGSPGPDLRRKPSVAVLASDGRVRAFVKIAGSRVADQLLRYEATVLPALEAISARDVRRPEMLFAGEVDGTYAMAQTPVEGRPVAPRLTEAHEQFLRGLIIGPPRPAAESALVRRVMERTAARSVEGTNLDGALRGALPALETPLPRTITHTDFVPWNLRRDADGVIGAFDWDTAEPDGLPLYDHAYHEATVGYCIRNWSPARAAGHLRALAASRPYGLTEEQARAIEVVTLVHALVRLLDQGHEESHEMVRWYAEVIERVRTAGVKQPTSSAGKKRPAAPPQQPAAVEPVAVRG